MDPAWKVASGEPALPSPAEALPAHEPQPTEEMAISSCTQGSATESQDARMLPSAGAVSPSSRGGQMASRDTAGPSCVAHTSPAAWEPAEPPTQSSEPKTTQATPKVATKPVPSQCMVMKLPVAEAVSEMAAPCLSAQAQRSPKADCDRAFATDPMLAEGMVRKPPLAASLALVGGQPQEVQHQPVPVKQHMAVQEPAAPESFAAALQPKRSKSASDRKSVLSMSAPMTSSAAGAALAGLGRANSKRRTVSQRSDAESTVPGVPPNAAAVLPAAAEAPPAEVAEQAARHAVEATDAAPKPKIAARSRSKGADASKSVISNFNGSSSAASALLGPMLQGSTKRRSTRQGGTDARSVI